jgi:hypothetical protein
MSDGEIIRNLLKSHVHHDEEGFRRAASRLIDQERRLNHRLLADDLERILHNGNGKVNGAQKNTIPISIVPKDKERGLPLLSLSRVDVPWEAVVLHPATLAAMSRCAEENRQRELLVNAGVKPKQKLLLCGPPGCGKTLSASALATDLGWELATVRIDSLMSSFLGETAANLRKVFEFISSGRYVVLFDECDAIGKERSGGQEHGELHRVVTALLQMMDAYSGESVIVFATNHQSMLDSALWRRFDLALKLDLPETQDRILMLRHFLRSLVHVPKMAEKQARAMSGASGADLYWLAQELIRSCLLAGRSSATSADFATAAAAMKQRSAAMLSNPSIPRHSPRSSKKRVSS